ncbi:MAG: hypothetical protein E6I91_04620 [Chloroflexi bacterium]|nr:MAG: hypothetical protein E6I91_04620 [Chloroflexota bacterium]
MAQEVSNPPDPKDEEKPHISEPLPVQSGRFSSTGIFILLVLISILIISSTSLLLPNLVQVYTHPGSGTAASPSATAQSTHAGPLSPTPVTDQNVTPTATPPIFTPNNTTAPSLQLPSGHEIIYEQQNNIYMISSTVSGTPQVLSTPGYIYNRAVRPILTPSGQLLYSGNGIYLMDIFGGAPEKIAALATNQVITSLALSSDGTMVAWSTEPAGGNGVIDLYAGSLAAPGKVFEQSSSTCPCFRIFAFMNNTTLLLTDGQQSHEAIQFGLWALDVSKPLNTTPQLLLDGNSPQGPLALAPYGNVLLYSSCEGQVPKPTDGSVPDDLAVLKYANSLKVTTLDGHPLKMDTSHVLLAEQHELHNSADYHWIETPVFTVDGHTLIYVEFSTEAQPPYDRSNALFIAKISGSGKQLHVSNAQLMATSNANLLEMGPWFNNHILTFYGDNSLYAMDVQTGAVATIVQTGAYARIIAVLSLGGS